MSALDRNKIFFGLVHYILSEQKNVDWILKTSLVNFTGINSTVTDQKYEKKSLSDDIIDYIHQVKPYHVQFEQFIEKYSNKQDDCNILPQDDCNIEIDVRFDAVTNEVDEQNVSDIQFMDTHAANRLWVCKHKDFNDDEMKSYIDDILNCHFKGIEVDGSEFDIDKFGYDTFLYDEKLYDAPTVSGDYYISDMTENLPYNYVKSYVEPGITTFFIGDENIGTLKVYRNGKNEKFNYDNGIITIYQSLNVNDKIIIENKIDGLRNGYVFACTSFKEYDDGDNFGKIVDLGTSEFKIPASQFGSRKVLVHIQYPNGTRIPTYNYERISNGIKLKDDLKEGYHVIITVVDYGELYDKIYTYEDCYGQSNNVISLDGNEFLRPYYEKKRPSELIATYPLTNLKIYIEEGNRLKSLYEIDYKNDNKEITISKTMTTKLKQDLNEGDKVIYVDNIKKLKMPYVNNSNVKIPGKILINSEIIEFYDYDEKENLLKSIRRGTAGSYMAEKHLKGDAVINYNDQTLKYHNHNVPAITTLCSNGQTMFEIPKNFVSNDKINVYYKPIIHLLSDISNESDFFIIDSDNIEQPNEVINKKGYIFINDDIIEFDNIQKIRNKSDVTYKISGFIINKDYYQNNSVIYGAKPQLLSNSEYIISDDKKNIILKNPTKKGEVIIVENEV